MSIDAGTLAVSLGPSAVGRTVSSPWFPGAHEVTQGWGPSNYDGEPEGHGYTHWHAGIDVGLPCGTDIHMPSGGGIGALYGTARWVDNPGGYGTALRIELKRLVGASRAGPGWERTQDLWLGHLRQRLVKDGEQVAPGDHLAVSNNTGNSTGCHLHFEVRPAGGRYGTDVDPSQLLLQATGDTSQSGSSTSDGNPYNPLDPRYGLWELEHAVSAGITDAERILLGVAQAGLGTILVLAGLAIVAYGLRGKNLGALRADTVELATRASRDRGPRPAPPEPRAEPGAGAELSGSEAARQARISRVRTTHQRELSRRQAAGDAGLSPEAREAVHAARFGRGSKLSPGVKSELRARQTRIAHPRRGSFRLRSA